MIRASCGRRCGARHRCGITLLEVLLAIMVIAVGVIGGLQATLANLRLADQTQSTLLAVRGVQEYTLEWLRSLDVNAPELSTSPAEHSSIPTPPGPPPALAALPGSNVRYWVEQEGGNPNLKKVTVEVLWSDPDTRSRSAVVTTLIGNNGLTDPNPS